MVINRKQRNDESKRKAFQIFVIRILDIFLSLLGIILAFPLMVAIAVIGCFDTGSPLFIQTRIGKARKPFLLIKFRTMGKNTPSLGTHLVKPSSTTKFGSFLRRTKLDELPQLFNVLIGQMSIVGPRPCLPNQNELILQRDRKGVYVASPGITGLAQINKVDMSTPRKLANYDSIMIKNMNIFLYLSLIFHTALGKGGGDRIV